MFKVIHTRQQTPGVAPDPSLIPEVVRGTRDTLKDAIAFAEDVKGGAAAGDVIEVCKVMRTFDVETTVRLKARAAPPEAAEPANGQSGAATGATGATA